MVEDEHSVTIAGVPSDIRVTLVDPGRARRAESDNYQASQRAGPVGDDLAPARSGIPRP
jgi:hypothetical protein